MPRDRRHPTPDRSRGVAGHRFGARRRDRQHGGYSRGNWTGSSGTFTVGLLKALRRSSGNTCQPRPAEEACRLEIDLLGQPVGKQDQYIAASAASPASSSTPTTRSRRKPLRVDDATLHDLEEHLLLFFTGYSRAANRDSLRSTLEVRSRRQRDGRVTHVHAVARARDQSCARIRATPQGSAN